MPCLALPLASFAMMNDLCGGDTLVRTVIPSERAACASRGTLSCRGAPFFRVLCERAGFARVAHFSRLLREVGILLHRPLRSRSDSRPRLSNQLFRGAPFFRALCERAGPPTAPHLLRGDFLIVIPRSAATRNLLISRSDSHPRPITRAPTRLAAPIPENP